MTPNTAALLLVFGSGGLLAIPLLPAFFEFWLKRDADPLFVIQQYTGDIQHFANGFRKYIAELQQPLQACIQSGTTKNGILPDGSKYLLLGRADAARSLIAQSMKKGECPLLLASGPDITLPECVHFSKEIYASGCFAGGRESTFRAVLGEKDIYLNRASRVMRWAHAGGSVHAGQDCELYGRISANREIQLQSGTVFQRLNAPHIAVGCARHGAMEPVSAGEGSAEAPVAAPAFRRLFETGMEIRPGDSVAGNLVTRGTLRIGAGARIWGSLKSNKRMAVEADVRVQGSLVCAERIEIGPRCVIHGPLLAERELVIRSGTRCGSSKHPTTVSAPRIVVEEGVQIFGSLWAREQGRVVPAR